MELSYFNIQKFCIHDGPGIRTTVFLKGCPLRCHWCHNPESQKMQPELFFSPNRCTACGRCTAFCKARTISAEGKLQLDRSLCALCGQCAEKCYNLANELQGKRASVEEILAEVLKDKPFYDTSGGGMTISGGEPAFQPEAVLKLLKKAGEKGIHSAIETCGVGSEAFFREAHKLNTLFLFDIKGIDPGKHLQNTGADNGLVLKNLRLLMELGAKPILRLPLIPGVNDGEEDLHLLREFLKEVSQNILYAEIMPYHNLGIDKSRKLGYSAEDTIPDGRPYGDYWLTSLRPSGTDIRISGQNKR